MVHGINFSALLPIANVEALESRGQRRLAEAKAVVRKAHPEVTVEVDLQHADPIPALVELSRHARLVVVGSRGLGGFSGILAGSTALGLVTRGHCPVVVVRGLAPGEAPPTQGPVVVGVDGSPTSEGAITLAFEEASMRNVDLVAAHTWIDFSDDYSYAYAHQFFMDWERIETEEKELLAQRLAGWREKYPDVVVQPVVTRDRPVRHLLKQAADAQLVVVGSRGRGGISGMLLGSTSRALIYHAPCPVIIARPITAAPAPSPTVAPAPSLRPEQVYQ